MSGPGPARAAAAVEPASALGLLADPDRLRVFAAVALGAADPAAVAAATGLPGRAVSVALSRLFGAGLLHDPTGSGTALAVHTAALGAAARTAAAQRPGGATPEQTGVDDPAAAAVLRAFLVDGRLTRIPAARAKRLVVLDHVARVFEIGVRYPEREVDALLRAFHPDYAALRRYLVDEAFLSRADGEYWRSGGSVAL